MELKRFKDSDDFVKIMENFIKRYQDDVKNNKDNYIKNWEDEKFLIWHIIKDAYDEGFKQADDYWVKTLFILTDAEDYFRDEIRSEI